MSTVSEIPHPTHKTQPPKQILEILTPEERKAYLVCTKNSSAIVPMFFSACMGYVAVRLTPFRSYAKYAAFASGLTGLLSGRLLIAETCLSKVASRSDSDLRERLLGVGYRSKLLYRGNQSQDDFRQMDVQTENQGTKDPSMGIVFDDYPSMNKYDTISLAEDTDLTEPMNLQKGVDYDELRRQNRDEFYNRNKRYTPETRYTPRTQREPSVARGTTEQASSTSDPSPMQEKTKYGDVWG